MAVEILTSDQIAFLKALGNTAGLVSKFYLTGGTPLAAFYLKHRYSEDLDFFSEEEVDPDEIQTFFKQQKKHLGIQGITTKQTFNRNLFFLELPSGTVKTEFTYFPFTRLEKTSDRKYGIEIDSPLDIAVNKLFAIYERTKARDYIDLYLLCHQFGFTIERLTKLVREKFDTHMEPIQLGAQFLKATEAEDAPRMITDLDTEVWQKFFQMEAGRFKDQILDQNDRKR